MKTNHDSTRLQLHLGNYPDFTGYAYVETIEARYRGMSLDEAMRVWKGHADADGTRVIAVVAGC